jgi:hypothetical protein
MNMCLSSKLVSLAVLFSTTLITGALVQQDKPLPPGAPTSTCEFHGAHNLEALHVLNGASPIPYVFDCGNNKPGVCMVGELHAVPHGPLSSVAIGVDHTQGAWSCVFADGVSGWIPTDRLSPLLDAPAIPSADWLGWWRSGKDVPHIENDRILITRSAANPRILHVSGRAYWYGLNDVVHFGQIDADAVAYGPLLHLVEGDGDGSCILDLTYNTASHTFIAVDNGQCGGMNVRFSGTWTRFTPTTRSRK